VLPDPQAQLRCRRQASGRGEGHGTQRSRSSGCSGRVRAPSSGDVGAQWRSATKAERGRRTSGISVRPTTTVGDSFSRRAISPCGLNENAPLWLCLRQQLSSQPPPHRQARSPLAKRRQGSQSQPPPTSRQGGLLAKNNGAFYSPSPRRDTFLRETSETIVISLHDFL
jgi:hypothetical protein